MKNTEICYQYRDACNYKMQNKAVVEGEYKPEDLEFIKDSLEGGEYFIPEQVGLHFTKFDKFDPEVDHPFGELDPEADISLTDEEPTEELKGKMTCEQLVENFKDARKTGWVESEVAV